MQFQECMHESNVKQKRLYFCELRAKGKTKKATLARLQQKGGLSRPLQPTQPAIGGTAIRTKCAHGCSVGGTRCVKKKKQEQN